MKDEVSDEPRHPYFWVSPNPSGASRELMNVDAVSEWLRDWLAEGISLEGIALTLEAVWLTDGEVEALPCV